jgi:hypothetical protein
MCLRISQEKFKKKEYEFRAESLRDDNYYSTLRDNERNLFCRICTSHFIGRWLPERREG